QLNAELRDRETDMPPPRDHQPRPRHDRFDEQLGLLVEHDGTRRSLSQRLDRGRARTRVQSVVAERPAAPRVGLDEQLACRDHILAALAHERRDGDGLAARGRREDVAEQIASSKSQHALARLDRDRDRAAAYQAGVPGEVLGQLVLAQRGFAALDDMLRLYERIAFDAPAAERADETPEVVDK